MIAMVQGLLGEVWDRRCIVHTPGGIGYELALTAPAFSRLPQKGENVSFHTSLVVREDAQELYGFESFEERRTFEALISISKVGARTALAMLSLYTPQDLRRIVAEENAHALVAVPGIGAKTAQHIFLELKYKLAGATDAPVASAPASLFADVLSALAGLGYAENECAPQVREILTKEPDLDAGSAIRKTLKMLAGNK